MCSPLLLSFSHLFVVLPGLFPHLPTFRPSQHNNKLPTWKGLSASVGGALSWSHLLGAAKCSKRKICFQTLFNNGIGYMKYRTPARGAEEWLAGTFTRVNMALPVVGKASVCRSDPLHSLIYRKSQSVDSWVVVSAGRWPRVDLRIAGVWVLKARSLTNWPTFWIIFPTPTLGLGWQPQNIFSVGSRIPSIWSRNKDL